MGSYSRRQFLQLAEITLLGTQLDHFESLLPQMGIYAQGRAFDPLPVYAAKNLQAALVAHLWPDSIVSIRRTDNEWYQVPGGYVRREAIQPIIPYIPQFDFQHPLSEFWAEVAAPVAPVREWCAAYAPFVTRIGHGGVAKVIDFLPGDQMGAGWYGIEDGNENLLGWTQAVYWRAVQESSDHFPYLTLHVDRQTQQLTVFRGQEAILQASSSTNDQIESGIYHVDGRRAAGAPLFIEGYGQLIHGAPWQIEFGNNHILSGVYWHNRFGSSTPGPAIQVTPLLAHWLYNHLGENSQIAID